MSNPKQILALERFDSYLEKEELYNNVRDLATYLSQQEPPFPTDKIKPTMSYLIETDELMKNDDLKLQLAISFVHAYRLSSPEQPINQDCENLIYRLFALLNDVFKRIGVKKYDDEQDDIILLLQLTNQIGLYGLAVGCGIEKDIFYTLIQTGRTEGVDNLAKMINEGERIPSSILLAMCETIISNKTTQTLLFKLNNIKQTEFVQSIRSNIQNLSAVECIKVYEKVSSVLKMQPAELYDYIQSDIENEDDQARETAVELLVNEFSEIPFNASNHEPIKHLISRHIDKKPKIRFLAVKFGFEELLKIKTYKKEFNKDLGQNADVIRSAIKDISNLVWDMADNRIVDTSAEVRREVLKGICHLDVKDIKLDDKIEMRLKDENHDVRIVALKTMLKLYDSKPDKYEGLIEQVIELYPHSKDITLYGFSILMSNHSLIDVASNLTHRKCLLDILKDTNELRMYLPDISKSPEAKEIVSRHVDIKKVSKLLKKAPKSFFESALNYKKRKQINKALKEKIGSDARLLLGIYQPCPLNIDDLLNCKNLDVVHDLAKVFTYQLEDSIPQLLDRCNKTDLTILATFKDYPLEDDDRTNILKKLIPVIQTTSKKRSLALKAFARLYQKSKVNDQLLDKIKFEKKNFQEKIVFYGHFMDKRVYNKRLIDEIHKNRDSIDEDFIKYALKIVIAEEDERTIDILNHFRVIYPDVSFKYYLLSARPCNAYITPDIFRQFAYVIQDEETQIRYNAIKYLNQALSIPSTPIHYLALFALSATDPVQENYEKAEKELRKQIQFRRSIMEQNKIFINNNQIIPETALPYLVNILAHHKDYNEDLKKNNLATFSMYLRFFLKPLCETTVHLSYISDLLTYYSLLEDIEDDYTDNSRKLFNLAIAITSELGKGKELDENPIQIEFEYSQRYFKSSEDKDQLRQLLKHSGTSMLKSPSRPKNPLRAGMSKDNLLKSKLPDLNSDDDSDEVSAKSKRKKQPAKNIKSAPTTPKRKPAKSTPKKSKGPSVVQSAVSTPRRGSVKSKKKAIEQDEDVDKEESPRVTRKKRASSAKANTKKSSTPKKIVKKPTTPKRTETPKKTETPKRTETPKKTESPRRSPRKK